MALSLFIVSFILLFKANQPPDVQARMLQLVGNRRNAAVSGRIGTLSVPSSSDASQNEDARPAEDGGLPRRKSTNSMIKANSKADCEREKVAADLATNIIFTSVSSRDSVTFVRAEADRVQFLYMSGQYLNVRANVVPETLRTSLAAPSLEINIVGTNHAYFSANKAGWIAFLRHVLRVSCSNIISLLNIHTLASFVRNH